MELHLPAQVEMNLSLLKFSCLHKVKLALFNKFYETSAPSFKVGIGYYLT